MKFGKKEFTLPFFLENGFDRRKCCVCGEFFWTQNAKMTTCGDAPCQEYTFIGNPNTKRSFTLDEMRESFLNFFERNGHIRIKPYPVIARWREDLFVTIASIADFQPYVTNGVIPPPANPLVVSQPCLRFLDIDNVGLTAGRHLVIFEMGGHHAFNYPNEYIYWKDETVRYHHRFITEVLGVNSEAVAYKEGSWSGGGNAGPCLEGSIGGLEVCTLVFMQYKVAHDGLVEMPLKIVDTGYGIERYTWLSQGTPSAFHAIYGSLLDRLLLLAGIGRVNERLLEESAKFSALMKLESNADRRELRRMVAKHMQIDVSELDSLLTPLESAYAIADHTKALAFMLAEGVVPSNVKAGYLTRLLVRRTYRLLHSLGIEDRLAEIMDWQIRLWSPSFPHLDEMRQEILEALLVEGEKYRSTLKRGAELTRKIAREFKSMGQEQIADNVLAELYDSHGFPPEIVAEAAKTEDMKVVIPDNFYTIVASRHQCPPPTKQGVDEAGLETVLSDLPSTEMLYYRDSYIREFKAKVLKVFEYGVVLDRTAFYPEGGGQEYDMGFLSSDCGVAQVVKVIKIGNIILHTLDGAPPEEGQEVIGEINWERRLSLMRHHTSTHLMLGAIRRVLGQHAWQAGAEKEMMHSRLDVSHWARISSKQLAEIEQLANERVMDNLPVEVTWLPREVAERTYGFRLYQGGVVPGREIRVVKVGDWDVEACGGTHLRVTGETGLIKILHTERIQDGVERLVFSSGLHAVKYIQTMEEQARIVSEALNSPIEQVGKFVSELCSKVRLLEKEVAQLRERMLLYEIEKAFRGAQNINGVRLIAQILEGVLPETIISAISELVKQEPDTVMVVSSTDSKAAIVVMAGEEAVKAGINAGIVASKAAIMLGGGGSGRPNFGQGGGSNVNKIKDAMKVAVDTVKDQLKQV